MKCLIIHTSYRQCNTYRVSQYLKSYMQTNGSIEFEELFLIKLNIPFCTGCNKCFFKGENFCPHHFIIQPIVEKIIRCDSLIITTPTYSLQAPAVLKCFIDHMSYNFLRPRFFDKKALVVVTESVAGAKPTACYMKQVLEGWGIGRINLFTLRCLGYNYLPNKEDFKQISIVAHDFYKETANYK